MTRRAVAVATAFVAAGLGAGAGCSSDKVCDGFEDDAGNCQATCDQSKCAADHLCVLNDCRPRCVTQADCPASFNCLEAIADDGVTQDFFCLQAGYSADGSTGQFVPCADDNQCDTARGYSCRHGECRIWGCATHDDCKTVGACLSDPGVPDKYCKVDEVPRGPGQYNSRCPLGDECDAENGFFCNGVGEGDIDAYCTQWGCEDDSGCPTGYYCTTRRSGFPCEDLCGLSGDPADPQCITTEEFERPGSGWSCGPYALMRKACIKRNYCITCETDSDCAAFPNQICAKDAGGAKICTTVCDENILNSCPGGSSSFCAVFDEERGVATCSHRYMSCVGNSEACSPCIEDSDCGAEGICLTIPTSGERLCLDLGFTCTKAAGTSDCPDTPGLIKMTCLDAADGLPPTSPLFQRCYAPDVEPSLQSTKISCWPK